MNIIFSQKAWEEYVAWQNQDEKIVIKINALIKDTAGNGMLSG
jgi:Txe/YoeB family toxin of Txe-Axe toxin-antitoxin module